MWPKDEWETAFKKKRWTFEWLVMPYGLTSAPWLKVSNNLTGLVHNCTPTILTFHVTNILVLINVVTITWGSVGTSVICEIWVWKINMKLILPFIDVRYSFNVIFKRGFLCLVVHAMGGQCYKIVTIITPARKAKGTRTSAPFFIEKRRYPYSQRK